MQTGRMDRRVTLSSSAPPAGGDPTAATYTTVATVWAERMDARGAERFAGIQVAAVGEAVYRIRYNVDVDPDPTWRMVDGDETWDILAVVPGPDRNRERFLYVRRLDPDNR